MNSRAKYSHKNCGRKIQETQGRGDTDVLKSAELSSHLPGGVADPRDCVRHVVVVWSQNNIIYDNSNVSRWEHFFQALIEIIIELQ